MERASFSWEQIGVPVAEGEPTHVEGVKSGPNNYYWFDNRHVALAQRIAEGSVKSGPASFDTAYRFWLKRKIRWGFVAPLDALLNVMEGCGPFDLTASLEGKREALRRFTELRDNGVTYNLDIATGKSGVIAIY